MKYMKLYEEFHLSKTVEKYADIILREKQKTAGGFKWKYQ